jgi:hypothetical protein
LNNRRSFGRVEARAPGSFDLDAPQHVSPKNAGLSRASWGALRHLPRPAAEWVVPILGITDSPIAMPRIEAARRPAVSGGPEKGLTIASVLFRN